MRSTEQILEELSGSKKVSQENTSIVRIQLGNYQKPRRTCQKPYISNFKGNAIMTIPYGAEKFEFSFSVRKAMAIQGMIDDGTWDRMVMEALALQENINNGVTLVKKKERKDVLEI